MFAKSKAPDVNKLVQGAFPFCKGFLTRPTCPVGQPAPNCLNGPPVLFKLNNLRMCKQTFSEKEYFRQRQASNLRSYFCCENEK